jgi:ElaB/YqjD/DUF883 family membrane-anchored ribosome-binding protein
MTEETTETGQIERDLAKTRARMDDRIEALQEKLTPTQMLNDAFASFRGGDGADFTRDLLARARENPLPVALTAIGLTWLMASSRRPVPNSKARATPMHHGNDVINRIRVAESGVVRGADEHNEAHASRLDEARGTVLGMTRNTAETASSYAERIKQALASATDAAVNKVHDYQSKGGSALSDVGDRVHRGATSLQKGAQDMATSTRNTLASLIGNPLALGAMAAVVGLIAGSVLPTLDEERDALGATAAKLRESGNGMAQSLVDKASKVAADAVSTAKNTAANHGLTADKPIGEFVNDAKSGALLDDVKSVARDTVTAGQDSAKAMLKPV